MTPTHSYAHLLRPKALVLSVAAAASLWSVAATAQQALEEIQVTGTRIRATDGMVMPTPVTAVTTDELSSFQPGSTVATQLSALPQFFNNNSSQRGGAPLFGDGGGSYLNMRNLGTNRTLTLLDGSRVVPADKRGTVNVDTLPTALIRTIDVVTGGASAAYGADALGGVTNFVLNRDYQGVKAEVGTGITELGDGFRWNTSLAGGTKIGDSAHLIGSVQATHINQINRDPTSLDSDWYQRWGYVTNPAWVSATATPNIPQRLSVPHVCSNEHSPTGVIWARTGATSGSPLVPFSMNGMTFTDDGKDVRQFIQGDYYVAPSRAGATKSMAGGPECDTANRAFGGGPAGNEVVQRTGFTAIKYDFSDKLTGFAQVLIGRSESNSVSERGNASLQDGWYATIYRENAFLPASVAKAMDDANITSFQLHKLGAFKGVNEPGVGQENNSAFTTVSWSVGFDYDLPNDWSLHGSWQTGQSHKRTGVFDEIRVDRMFLAMDAVRDSKGGIVCNVQLYNPTPAQLQAAVAGQLESPGGSPGGTKDPLSTNPLLSPIGLDNTVRDCVPWNVFGNGNASSAALAYLTTPKMGDSIVNQDFAEMVLSGDLFQGWAGTVNFAAGLTYRNQDFHENALPRDIDVLGPPQNAPSIGIRGIPAGYTGGSANLHQFSTVPDVEGAYDVWEYFGELNVPLWVRGGGPQRIDSNLSYRSSDYSSIGRIASWKLGVEFQVLEDLRLRATKSRDVREATFSERFDFQGGGGTVNDPRFNGTSTQITTVSGGNKNLKPEVADTVVAGIVYQPSWLDGLRLSTDWYNIQIKDAISTLGVQRIVDECQAGNANLCAMVERDPTTGFIGRVFNTFVNVAQAKVEGVDFEGVYKMEPNFFQDEDESLNLRMLFGYVIERSDTPLGGQPLNQAGWIGTPDLTGVGTLTYNVGAYSVQLQQQYTAATENRNTGASSSWVVGKDVDTLRVSSGNYTNLQLGYKGQSSGGVDYRLAFNVTNLFDRNPPIVVSYGTRGGAQTTPSAFDTYGRRYQISLNMNF
ncbi:MAG: TonB-dependent receptor [Pseudomonadales bacterium]|jgi:outer membrane receptor protein involved in Fe transport|nr:TonB-dependent receptor [Pseudomonadales bacterium]